MYPSKFQFFTHLVLCLDLIDVTSIVEKDIDFRFLRPEPIEYFATFTLESMPLASIASYVLLLYSLRTEMIRNDS